MPRVLGRTEARFLLSLYDYAFKRGVIDAAYVDDDHFCECFLEKRRPTNSFGTLSCEYDMDWKEWRFNLGQWCSRCRLYTLYTKFFININMPGYNMVSIVIAQDFYNEGIREWLDYKNPLPLEIFKTQTRVHWKPIDGKTFKPIYKRDLISMAQEFAFVRGHRTKEEEEKFISENSYRVFSMELWRATRPIPKLDLGDF